MRGTRQRRPTWCPETRSSIRIQPRHDSRPCRVNAGLGPEPPMSLHPPSARTRSRSSRQRAGKCSRTRGRPTVGQRRNRCSRQTVVCRFESGPGPCWRSWCKTPGALISDAAAGAFPILGAQFALGKLACCGARERPEVIGPRRHVPREPFSAHPLEVGLHRSLVGARARPTLDASATRNGVTASQPPGDNSPSTIRVPQLHTALCLRSAIVRTSGR